MIFTRVFSILLRILQLAAAAVVTGITSDYIADVNKANGNPADRIVYTLVIAVFSIITAFILLIPFTATLTMFPLDFLFFILWIVLVLKALRGEMFELPLLGKIASRQSA